MVYFFKTPFAQAGTVATVPRATQVDGSVSYEEGWGLDYQLDPDSEPTARDIPRDQFNQIMLSITQVLNQYQTQAFPDFITTSDNDGTPYSYSINATVRFTGGWAGAGAMNYYSLVDANVVDPTDATKWGLVQYSTPELPGVTKAYYGNTLPTGYVWANGTTIGSLASGATGRANADTLALYTVLWNSLTNAVLPIQDSGGAASSRGVSAAADFAANKRLPTPNECGRAGVGTDNMGGITAAGRITTAGCGIDGSIPGAAGGAQNVSLSAAQNGPHTHSASTTTAGDHYHAGTTNSSGTHQHNTPVKTAGSGNPFQFALAFSPWTNTSTYENQLSDSAGAHTHGFNTDHAGDHTHPVTVDTQGSGSAHLNVQPTIIRNSIIALGTA